MRMWNVFNRPKILRTTKNMNIGTYCGTKTLGHQKLCFWIIVQKLSDREQKSKIEIRRYSRGEPPLPQRTRYKYLNEKLSGQTERSYCFTKL